MNRQITELLSFLKKNRIFIYILLGIALMLQICSRGALPPVRTTEPQVKEITSETETPSTVQQDAPNNPSPKPHTDFSNLLLMVALILGFFVAKRYGWLDKILPKVVIFKVDYFKQKTTGNLIIKVFLINRTNKSITFNNPNILFFKGSQKREFVIKNVGGQNYFPITLTPGTGHKFNIDVQKFYNNVEGLKEFKTVRMEVKSTTGKTHKSMKWPVWLTFRRI